MVHYVPDDGVAVVNKRGRQCKDLVTTSEFVLRLTVALFSCCFSNICSPLANRRRYKVNFCLIIRSPFQSVISTSINSKLNLVDVIDGVYSTLVKRLKSNVDPITSFSLFQC